ncbi:MAG: hypothetical protein J4O08_07090 [Chloroflexi bacterium]|nr:hypothetical protein [Chloroflexota bacterium]
MDASQLTTAEVLEMARMAGLSPDDQRAEAIAARLGAVLQALSEVPDESVADYQPALTFTPTGAPKAVPRNQPGGKD